MLKIGEFARVCGITTATLRYYDSCGLLKPVSTDQENNYRYYNLEQLPRLNRILTFKDLGFSLEQITHLLNEDVPLEQLRGMFKLKQAETQQLIAAEQARLSRIQARLRQIEQEKTMQQTYEIVLKQVEPLLIASVREIISSVNNLNQSWEVLHSYMRQQGVSGVGPNLILWHDESTHDEGVDAETAESLASAIPEAAQIKVRTLPGATMASTVHHGGYDTIAQAYTALYQWVADNQYSISGPTRQVHLQYDYGMDPSLYVTELQFPIEKK